jgi:hypothetical protein
MQSPKKTTDTSPTADTKRKRSASANTQNKKSKQPPPSRLPEAPKPARVNPDQPYDYVQAYLDEVTSLGRGPQESTDSFPHLGTFYGETLSRIPLVLRRPAATSSSSLVALDGAFRAIYGSPSRESMRECADTIFRVDGTQRPDLFRCLPKELTEIILVMAGEPASLRAVCRQWCDIVNWDTRIRDLIVLANLALLKTIPRYIQPVSWPNLCASGLGKNPTRTVKENLLFDKGSDSFIRIPNHSVPTLDWEDTDRFAKGIDEMVPPFGRITPAEAFRWMKERFARGGRSGMEIHMLDLPKLLHELPRKVLPFLLEMTEEQEKTWIALSASFRRTRHRGPDDFKISRFDVAYRAKGIYLRPDVWAEMVLFVEKAGLGC